MGWFAMTLFLTVFTPCVMHAGTYRDIEERDVEKVLLRLDKEIERRDGYNMLCESRIDSIKSRRRGTAPGSMPWMDATMKIARSYSSFNIDSALSYYTEGLEMARSLKNDSLLTEFKVRRATYLTVSGYVHDAINEFEAVDTTGFGEGLKRTYYASGRQMYSYISNYYDGFLSTYDYWNNRALTAQRALIGHLPQGSPDYRLNLGEYLFAVREYARSRSMLLDLINDIDPDTSAYAIACNILSDIAKARGNRNEQIYYLALSAITDTRMGQREVTSIQELGGILFEIGDSRRAHDYLITAMNNAVESRASVRLSHISELLAVIENDHLRQIAQWRRLIYIIIAGLLASLFALMAAMYFLRRELHRVARMKYHLEESNKTKEVYISRFMALCSIYMDKLKQFCKLTNRKITAGQVDELLKLTKSGKFIEEQSREFYAVFDDAFLHIYPDFVEKVNALLRPEEKIVLQEGEMLNSDLRILAFMRLGIDDTTRVAQILNYSVNTIYAYRNKLKNKAICRDTFESDIQAI